jgi:glycosyltransferase involved in cell wall biosynthesis
MKTQSPPLISIVTPAYNEETHLVECIESVLAQTYTNWDYTIVNNCSKDETLAIAQRYASRDTRIRVVSNDRLMPIVENHNHAIRQISPDSKYCKFVFADDWLYPSCIEEMVHVAEENPSVGLVGAYTMDGRSVIWPGPPYPAHRVSGREVCRSLLLGGPYVFGPMTSLLVRSDMVRRRPVFFNENNLHADTEICYDLLRESDYGFVHQVLSFSRQRPQSNGSFAENFNSIELGTFVVFLKFAPLFLEDDEYRRRFKEARREYHQVLAHNLLRVRSKDFWEYHKRTLAAFGSRIDWWLLTRLAVLDFLNKLSHPLNAVKRGWRWWSRDIGKPAIEAIPARIGRPE